MIIGITGSFGSGKTTVAKMFAKLGAHVIDADRVYHSLIRQGSGCYKKLIKNFSFYKNIYITPLFTGSYINIYFIIFFDH